MSDKLTLTEKYSLDNSNFDSNYEGYSIISIFNGLEYENNIFEFRTAFLASFQLYFDSLIFRTFDENKSLKQKKVLEEMIDVGSDFFEKFYNLETIRDIDKYKQVFLDNKDLIIDSSLGLEPSKKIYLGESEYSNIVLDKLKRFEMNLGLVKSMDYIIPILSGGLEFGLAIKNKFPDAQFLPVRYSVISRDDKSIQIPSMYKNKITEHKNLDFISNDTIDYLGQVKDKNILIVDDIYESGKTLNNCISAFTELNPSLVYSDYIYKLQQSKSIINPETLNYLNKNFEKRTYGL